MVEGRKAPVAKVDAVIGEHGHRDGDAVVGELDLAIGSDNGEDEAGGEEVGGRGEVELEEAEREDSEDGATGAVEDVKDVAGDGGGRMAAVRMRES
ncbi:glutamine-dependent NAD(+) synthetase isoform X2 [Iris pallida]|uniref:Glutamine-dependent NAD(+) synthetase isoform X2 n=1 Tax=Iris pallida TaxID=29817 RepID=A0AAX6DPL2_IRIPA|nr:glutamine-dependent NAD(+) synthetase isoform X2 [Iris pallida]